MSVLDLSDQFGFSLLSVALWAAILEELCTGALLSWSYCFDAGATNNIATLQVDILKLIGFTFIQ